MKTKQKIVEDDMFDVMLDIICSGLIPSIAWFWAGFFMHLMGLYSVFIPSVLEFIWIVVTYDDLKEIIENCQNKKVRK